MTGEELTSPWLIPTEPYIETPPQQCTQGSCYWISDIEMSWQDARQYCMATGGFLAEIESEGENEFLHSIADGMECIEMFS